MMSRTELIVRGLREQNEPAKFQGATGFWCQADCVFIEAESAPHAIQIYRDKLSKASIAISHNHFCDAIIRAEKGTARDALIRPVPISYLWLREHGFQIEYPFQNPTPSMSISTGRDDTYLEVSPVRDESGEWFCWFRNDLASRRGRFIHTRHLRSTHDVSIMFLALSGRELEQQLTMDDDRKAKFNEALAKAKEFGEMNWKQYCDFAHDFMMRHG